MRRIKRIRDWSRRRHTTSTAVRADSFTKSRTLRSGRGWLDVLNSYQGLLSRAFLGRVAQARTKPLVWIDGGAGTGHAQAQAVASFEHLQAVSLTMSEGAESRDERHQVIRGPLHELPNKKKAWARLRGKADLVTDVFGAFSYSDPVEAILLYGELARPARREVPGGVIEIVIPGSTTFREKGRPVGIERWLSRARGLELESISRSEGQLPVAVLRRTGGPVVLPDLDAVRYDESTSNSLPTRRFEIRDDYVARDH